MRYFNLELFSNPFLLTPAPCGQPSRRGRSSRLQVPNEEQVDTREYPAASQPRLRPRRRTNLGGESSATGRSPRKSAARASRRPHGQPGSARLRSSHKVRPAAGFDSTRRQVGPNPEIRAKKTPRKSAAGNRAISSALSPSFRPSSFPSRTSCGPRCARS
jgi:hypothetical protein